MEYINGVNAIGNMSVDSDKVSYDVHTSRCVVVDDALYESDANYKAKVDKCIEEGLYRVSSDGSDGSGVGVLMVHITAQPDFSTNPPTVVYTSDKTYEEVYNAYNDGKAVVIESGTLSGAIFTKRDSMDVFYSTPNTLVSKTGVNAIITQNFFTLGADDSVELIEKSIKVATVS